MQYASHKFASFISENTTPEDFGTKNIGNIT
jgi:hypothetical protein